MNPPSRDAEDRRASILDAALRVFGQYGYRRTSMDDVARAAGISKGSIYLSFAGKDEVFLALSQSLCKWMLNDAETAGRQPGTITERLTAICAAWFGTYVETIRRSPHADELMDAKHRLSADVVSRATTRYKRLVRDVVAEAAATGELDLESVGITVDTTAELLIASSRGLQSSAASPTTFHRHLNALVRVMVAGLGGRLPADGPG